MSELTQAVRALLNVLSDNINDYPDASAYRQIQDRVKVVEERIAEVERAEPIYHEDCEEWGYCQEQECNGCTCYVPKKGNNDE